MHEKSTMRLSGQDPQRSSSMDSAFDQDEASGLVSMSPPAFAPTASRGIPSGDAPGGLPLQLQHGIEHLAGVSMEGVTVHRNSSEPAKIHAEAYAEGDDIYLGPGKEAHLPHEAWHVAQQRLGKVSATTKVAGKSINTDPALEEDATEMGAKAMQIAVDPAQMPALAHSDAAHGQVAQAMVEELLKLLLTLGVMIGLAALFRLLASWKRQGLSEDQMAKLTQSELQNPSEERQPATETTTAETQTNLISQVLSGPTPPSQEKEGGKENLPQTHIGNSNGINSSVAEEAVHQPTQPPFTENEQKAPSTSKISGSSNDNSNNLSIMESGNLLSHSGPVTTTSSSSNLFGSNSNNNHDPGEWRDQIDVPYDELRQFENLKRSLGNTPKLSERDKHLIRLAEKASRTGVLTYGEYQDLLAAVRSPKSSKSYKPTASSSIQQLPVAPPPGFVLVTDDFGSSCYLQGQDIIEDDDQRIALNHLMQGGNAHHRTANLSKKSAKITFSKDVFYLHIGHGDARLYLIQRVGVHTDGRDIYRVVRKGSMGQGNEHTF